MKFYLYMFWVALTLTSACDGKSGSRNRDPVNPEINTKADQNGDKDPHGIVLADDGCLKEKTWEQAMVEEDSIRLLAKVFAQPDDVESQVAVRKAEEGKLICN